MGGKGPELVPIQLAGDTSIRSMKNVTSSMIANFKMLSMSLSLKDVFSLTLFQYTRCQFGTSLPFSLYLRHGFRSDSENVYGNRVKIEII